MNWTELDLTNDQRLVRDEQYGFMKVMPRPTDEQLTEFYSRAYVNPCVLHDPEGRADLVCEAFEKPGRVLDIGCGRGELLEVFKRRGWEVVGLEPSDEYSEAARVRGIPVHQTQLREDVIAQLGTFDAVLLVHVLEHLPDPESYVKLVRRLLEPGGIFYCEVPNDFNALQVAAMKTHGLRPWWIALPDHLNYFNIESLAGFIGGHGFEVVKKTTDFPVELFLLWGDVYIDNPEAGKAMHEKRVRFERTMREAGEGRLLQRIYDQLAELGVGREAIVCARKLSD